LTLLLLPLPIVILIISILILLLAAHHFNLILNSYRFLVESYDLVSKSLIILTIWVIILIIVAQKNVEYKKNLSLNMIILLISLIITFSTVRIIMFYFFFE